MKYLAATQNPGTPETQSLRIGGTPFPIPSSIQPVFDRAGYFGGNIFSLGIQLMILTALILAIFFIIWSGIAWITSEGDKQKLQAARSRLTYSIIGLVIVLAGFLIVSIIGTIFGIKLFGP